MKKVNYKRNCAVTKVFKYWAASLLDDEKHLVNGSPQRDSRYYGGCGLPQCASCRTWRALPRAPKTDATLPIAPEPPLFYQHMMRETRTMRKMVANVKTHNKELYVALKGWLGSLSCDARGTEHLRSAKLVPTTKDKHSRGERWVKTNIAAHRLGGTYRSGPYSRATAPKHAVLNTDQLTEMLTNQRRAQIQNGIMGAKPTGTLDRISLSLEEVDTLEDCGVDTVVIGRSVNSACVRYVPHQLKDLPKLDERSIELYGLRAISHAKRHTILHAKQLRDSSVPRQGMYQCRTLITECTDVRWSACDVNMTVHDVWFVNICMNRDHLTDSNGRRIDTTPKVYKTLKGAEAEYTRRVMAATIDELL